MGGSAWKPIVEIQKGAGCLPYGNNKLPGAEFTIYNEQGKEVVKGKTNEQGIAKFEKLPAGKYTYKETFAPEGYLINEETFSFEIKTDGQIIKHTVQDKKKEVPPTPEQPGQPQQPEQPGQPQQPEQPGQPQQPEQPQPEKSEELNKNEKSIKHQMPQTGGSVSNLPLIGLGVVILAGIFFILAIAKRNKHN